MRLRRPRNVGRLAVAGATGIVVALVALAVAEALTVLTRSWRSPVLDVGDRMVDLMSQYPRLKQAAIDLLGNADKPALLIGIGVLLLGYSFVLGIVAMLKNLRVGVAMIGLFAVIGVWAALGRKSDGSLFSALPTIIGSIAGGLVLSQLHRRLATKLPRPRLAGESQPAPSAESSDVALWSPEHPAVMVGGGTDRRGFLAGSGALLGATAAGAAVLGLGGRQAARRRFSASGSRKNVTVPTAEDALDALPTGVQADVPGMTPFITPNDRFYRVDTALEVPQLTTAGYRLKVKGYVANELELTWQDLLNRPMIERDVTLTCVSNQVGGSYIGNARWIGARLDDLLREAAPLDNADMVVGRSVDGWECGFPLENALDGRDAMIAVAMNGQPLPLEHGFPARLVVPGLYGYVSATKWLTEIELTRFDEFDHYWEQRGWAEKAPIKLMSRIDVPRGLATVAAGEVAVGGVAWQQTIGIAKVEVRIDEGEWVAATLAEQDTLDTWRQWSYRWNATPGRHTIRVRATDPDGNVQTDQRAEPIPDGATGHHQIVVIVK
jgi:DMSO/TMAO reductase YedYZ molybdopterin-dependent catalytic subunit